MRAVGAMRLARVAGYMGGGRLMSAHIPVMRDRVVELMRPAVERAEPIVVDATLGAGGHAEALLLAFPGLYLIGIDRDTDALAQARSRLHRFDGRTELTHAIYDEIGEVLDGRTVAAVLFDLGVSSMQLDRAARGFSYAHDAPLDMRMDRSEGLTAYDVVNTYDQESLKRILYTYGEERYAPKIAAAIVKRRAEKPIETTLELAELIRAAMPPQALREKQHPAKRSFQAIRIAVNDELTAVERMLASAIDRLNPGGRLAVITFHSLEDRLVKSAMQEAAKGCICPKEFPVCVCGRTPKVKILTRHPIVADEAELAENPRARSAKLRVAERI